MYDFQAGDVFEIYGMASSVFAVSSTKVTVFVIQTGALENFTLAAFDEMVAQEYALRISPKRTEEFSAWINK